ncbi:MAG TPA: hypothetical protein VG816_09585 [Solirubrobacterales bacterium]|nr:hypothetical protein [Solirubrobacterales bacterium]
MARPTDGKIAKAGSRSALFAHVAARLHLRLQKRDSSFFKDELGVNINEKAGRDAAAPLKSSLRKWVLVREPDLDLDVSLLRFRPGERSPEEIFEALEALSGVRQLLQIASTGEVLAIVIFDGARARRELRAVIQERIQIRPQWDEIERETFDPALRTWRELARKVASDENLLIS